MPRSPQDAWYAALSAPPRPDQGEDEPTAAFPLPPDDEDLGQQPDS